LRGFDSHRLHKLEAGHDLLRVGRFGGPAVCVKAGRKCTLWRRLRIDRRPILEREDVHDVLDLEL